jgi:hypothetical protein
MAFRAAIQCGNLAENHAGRDLARAERYALDAVTYAHQVGDHTLISFAATGLAQVRLQQGAWDDIDLATLTAQLDGLHGQARYAQLVHLASFQLWRGDPLAVDRWLVDEPSTEDTYLREGQVSVRVLAAIDRGDLDVAFAGGDELLELWDEAGLEPTNPTWPTLVTLALDEGRIAIARRFVAFVADRPPGLLPALNVGQLRWFEARLAALADDHDRAGERFVAAADVLRGLGSRWWLARVQADHAGWAADQGAPRRAAELAREAREAFAAMGARPSRERAEALLRDLGEPIDDDTTTAVSGPVGP